MKRIGVVLLSLVACSIVFVVQIRRAESAMTRSAAHVLQKTFGLNLAIAGSVEVHLFPRPHVTLTDVSLRDQERGAQLDIPELEATQSFASLLSGRVSFSQLRLIDATGSIDADRWFEKAEQPGLGPLGWSFPGRIAMSAGVVAVRSRNPAMAGLMTGFNAVVEGLDRNGTAVLSGHGLWRGQRMEISARLEPFFDFVLGRDTSGSFKLHLPALSVAVDGQLHAGIHGGFDGKVAASTSSLSSLIRTEGRASGLSQMAERVGFSAHGVAGPGSMTFSDARLSLDDTQFEGSLAWQPNQGHGAWTGTFATDTLDLAHVFDGLPQARDRDGQWSDNRWLLDKALWGDVDLRVSASLARLGPIDIEDAAFSALCRDGRVEVSLSEARTLDGLIRGRAVASLRPASVDVKLDLSMSQMDLDRLSRSLGHRTVSGSATGHFTGEATGSSPKSLVESLKGHGEISIRQGSVPPIGTMVDVSSLSPAGVLLSASSSSQAFDLGTADLDVKNGELNVKNGRLIGPAVDQVFEGGASLLDRSFSLALKDAPETPALEQDEVTINLGGVWDKNLRLLRLERSRSRSQPADVPSPAGYLP